MVTHNLLGFKNDLRQYVRLCFSCFMSEINESHALIFNKLNYFLQLIGFIL